MVLNKGGYVMINKAQDNVYELATSALTSGKPILWYETNTECYFIDTITLNGTDIILTKGGKTITIESDGDITEVDIQNHLYKHFITFDIENTSDLDTNHFFFTYYSYDNSEINTYAKLKALIKDKIIKLPLSFSMIDNKIFNNHFGNFMYIDSNDLTVEDTNGDTYTISDNSAFIYFLKNVLDTIKEDF